MTAKEYLRQYEELTKRAELLRAEYEEEKENIDTIRSSVGDGTPHGGSISKQVEIRALKLIDKALDLKQAELDAIQRRQEIFEFVQAIPGVKGRILYWRYVKLIKDWNLIANKVGYSWRHTLRLHGEILREFDEKMSLNVTKDM